MPNIFKLVAFTLKPVHLNALGSEDDGEKFGLPAPVDGSKLATELLSGSTLSQAIFTEKTGDITLEFGAEIRLEVFNNFRIRGVELWDSNQVSR